MAKVHPVPEGHHTVTPHLVLQDTMKAIDWYKKALGAEVVAIMPGPDNKGVMHAELKIGDSIIMCADEFPGTEMSAPTSAKTTTVALHLYVNDADATFGRAVAAGAKVTMPVMDMFWGDRFGKFADPFGHSWSVATHKEDVSPEECTRRGIEFMKQMGKEGSCGSGG